MMTYAQGALVALVAVAAGFYVGARLVLWHLFNCCLCASTVGHHFTHKHNARCLSTASRHNLHDDALWPPGPGGAHP